MRRFVYLTPLLLLVAFVAWEAYVIFRAQLYGRVILIERPLQLKQVSLDRQAWLLTVEDPNFYAHKGFDFATPGQGDTTLTQSLVQLIGYERFRTGFVRLERGLIARLVIHPATPKRDQLEIFFNRADFGTKDGREVIGFSAAARTWFGKDFSQLSDREYLALVAMLIAPNALDPVRHPRENAERVRRIELLTTARCRPADSGDVWYAGCKSSPERGGGGA